MIIYGSRNIQLAKETLTDHCPNCGTQNSVELFVFQKYAHVFWIPFFPMGKTALSQCDHCKQVLKLKEMPALLKSSYEVLKTQTKTPAWTFAGIGIVAILISAGIYSNKQNDKKNAELIAAPKSGDVFEIKTAGNQYTLYKVDHIKGDTAFVLLHQFETDKLSGIKSLKEKRNNGFSDEIMPLSKAALNEMFQKGSIIDIERN
jgi:zinc-ribbon family